MYKKIIAVLLILIVTKSSFAQIQQILEAIKPAKAFEGTPILEKKSQVIQFGIGAPNNAASLLNFGGMLGNNKSKGIGPIFVNYEYLLRDNFGIGIGLMTASAQQDYSSIILGTFGASSSAKINLFQIALNSTYHIYTTDNLDPYVKVALGVNLTKITYSDGRPFTAPTPFGYQAITGLRYFPSKNIGLFGELGFTSLKFSANVGVACKLK